MIVKKYEINVRGQSNKNQGIVSAKDRNSVPAKLSEMIYGQNTEVVIGHNTEIVLRQSLDTIPGARIKKFVISTAPINVLKNLL